MKLLSFVCSNSKSNCAVNASTKALCPCPPETAPLAVAVDGGIFGNQRICKALFVAIDEISSGLDMDDYPEAYEAVDLLTAVLNRLDNSFNDCQAMMICCACRNQVTEYELEVCGGVCSNCVEK